MADPVDEIIDTLNPQPPADPPADPPANTATIDKAELERLQQIARQFDAVAPTIQALQENPNLIHDIRARMVEQQTTPPPQDTPGEDYDWANPAASTKKIAEQTMQQYAAPVLNATNEKLANLAIANFKATLISNPYYHVAMPLFEKNLKPINKAQLGAQSDETILNVLSAAWRAAIGEYSEGVTQKRMQERAAAAPPANLGGAAPGGTSVGPKQKRTLDDIDPATAALIRATGLSEEDALAIIEGTEG